MPCCRYFSGTGKLASAYRIGISWSEEDQIWNHESGTNAGNGAVSNDAPYAHFSYNFQVKPHTCSIEFACTPADHARCGTECSAAVPSCCRVLTDQ